MSAESFAISIRWSRSPFLGNRGQMRYLANVRFGSEADICAATIHVRFTPNSDRESRTPATGHVCFTPESGHVQCNCRCPLWAYMDPARLQQVDGIRFNGHNC